jgi:hypothetical protein
MPPVNAREAACDSSDVVRCHLLTIAAMNGYVSITPPAHREQRAIQDFANDAGRRFSLHTLPKELS